MKPLAGRGPCVDIGQSSLKAFYRGRGLEVPLERGPEGRITGASREAAARELRALAGGSFGVARRALCAISARGVSLRRLALPPSSSPAELERLLELQVETEFPLRPADLAWGYLLLEPGGPEGNGSRPRQALVAALRREALEDAQALLDEAGLRASFRLAPLEASRLCALPAGGRAWLLDIGRAHSQLLSFEGGRPAELRVLPWGGERVTRALAARLGVSAVEAEELKRTLGEAGDPPATGEEPTRRVPAANLEEARAVAREEVRALADLLRAVLPAAAGGNGAGEGPAPLRLVLLGGGSRQAGLPGALAEDLGEAVEVSRLPVEEGGGRSAVILGLGSEASGPTAGAARCLSLNQAPSARPLAARRTTRARWIAAVLALGVLSLGLRWVPPLVLSSRLEERLRTQRERRASLPSLDRELGFLEHLEASQAPCLDALAAVAAGAPPGTQVSYFSVSRSGELTLRGIFPGAAEVHSLRRKLLESGEFLSVSIDEQAPDKERKHLEVRLSARLKPRRPGPGAAGGAPPGPGAPSSAGAAVAGKPEAAGPPAKGEAPAAALPQASGAASAEAAPQPGGGEPAKVGPQPAAPAAAPGQAVPARAEPSAPAGAAPAAAGGAAPTATGTAPAAADTAPAAAGTTPGPAAKDSDAKASDAKASTSSTGDASAGSEALPERKATP